MVPMSNAGAFDGMEGSSGRRYRLRVCRPHRLMYWFGLKALPVQYKPNGFLRRRHRSLFKPCPGRENWRGPIYGGGAETIFLASPLSYLCLGSEFSVLGWGAPSAPRRRF